MGKLEKAGCMFLLTLAVIFYCTPNLHAQSDTDLGEGIPWQSMFNGKDLDGWSGLEGVWKVENGEIVTTKSPRGTFLVYEKEYSDFIFESDVFLADNKGNSGIQYRSRVIDSLNWDVKGYQANIKEGFGTNQGWGELYHEHGDGWIASVSSSIKKSIHINDWNHYRIIAQGNRLQHILNGEVWLDFTDEKNRASSGIFALQHHGGSMELHFKNIRIKDLTEKPTTVFQAAPMSYAGPGNKSCQNQSAEYPLTQPRNRAPGL